ncbi:MAG TPA: VWA domain-containing protein, partial [Anaerolineae bacterium]|nr:VWA domain-containing protein [Anaerolineae bacterium]
HQISLNDWIRGRPGVSNSSQVRAALDALLTLDITVPVWDLTQGNGSNTLYRAVNFARMRLTDYHLPGQNRLSARFLGYVSCSDVTPSPTPSLTPTRTPSPTPTPVSTCTSAQQPVDVVLVLDRSGSMAGQPLTHAKQAAQSFVDAMQLSTDQVGSVSFSTQAHLDQRLTHHGDLVKQAIHTLSADGMTNLAGAITTAQQELLSSRHNPAAQPVMILLSDGQPTAGGDALAAAQAAQQAGIRVITIGLGRDVNVDLMRAIASTEADYHPAPTSADLLAIYLEIAGGLHCATPTPTATPTFTRTPTLTPTPTSTCASSQQPLDVILVLDRSGSMAGQPLNDAKHAAKSFVDAMHLANDQVGLVSFSSEARLDQRLTHQAGLVKQAIEALASDRVTNIAAAITTAQQELVSNRHNPAALPVIILLSDGQPTAGGNPLTAAQAAKQAGTRIITIGLGRDVNADLMRAIASAATDYHAAPTSADLLAIYLEIAGDLYCRTPTPTATPSATPGSCSAGTLGAAADYNGFFLENFSGARDAHGNLLPGSDVAGRLAVGHDLSVASYSVGHAVAGPVQDVLVVGHDLNFKGGRVHGNALYGSAATVSQNTGFDGVLRRSVPVPLDFAAAGQELLARSDNYANLTVNGDTSVQDWGGPTAQIIFSGSDPDLNVFRVSGADMNRAYGVFISAPAGSTVLINIDGTTDRLMNFGFFLWGVNRQHVLYNFYQAQTLELSQIGIQGSILAPRANITFNLGALWGQLIGKSFVGAGELDDARFTGCIPTSP